MKAWSQNLGHENLNTSLTSCGTIDRHRQGEVMAGISLEPDTANDDLVAKIRKLVR